jgi:hypothetical protein
MVPAGLYALNNYLKFLMQLYFKPTTTKMLGNLKVSGVKAAHSLVAYVRLCIRRARGF